MTERSPLLGQILNLDPLLTELEGVASAMLGAGCEEVSHDCSRGVAWLSGHNSGLVNRLRAEFNKLYEAAGGQTSCRSRP